MASRDGAIARAVRVTKSDQARVLTDLARARRTAGLSHRDVGRACGMSRSMVARIESGQRTATAAELAAIGAAVGLDIRLHAYPAGDPIRDAGQQRLLERFRLHLDESIVMTTEVPLPIEGDLRGWDAILRTRTWHKPVEGETVIDDVQALERRVRLKVRDGGVDGVILVVANTRRNRRAIAAAPSAFQEFDRDARRAARGPPWPPRPGRQRDRVRLTERRGSARQRAVAADPGRRRAERHEDADDVINREAVDQVPARVRRVARDPERKAAHEPVGALLALAMGRPLGGLTGANRLDGRRRLASGRGGRRNGDRRRGGSDPRRRTDPPGHSNSDDAGQHDRRHPQRHPARASRADGALSREPVSRGR